MTVLLFPQRAKMTKIYCPKCHAEGEIGCDCGVGYVRAGEIADSWAADPANASKSTRDGAKETGVNQTTIVRARRKLSEANASPKPARTKVTDPHKDTIIARASEGHTHEQIASETNVHRRSVGRLLQDEQIRQAAFAELGVVSLEWLKSATAFAKLEVAIRVKRKELERSFDAAVEAKFQERIAVAVPRLQEAKNEAFRERDQYRKFMQEQKKIFTGEEYKVILMCLHPDGDRSAEKRAHAFRTFSAKKFALTGEK